MTLDEAIQHAREDMPALLSYIAELEAVADVARKRDAKIKEWRNMRYVNGLAADTRKINQELCKFDDELHNVLAKLDGEK